MAEFDRYNTSPEFKLTEPKSRHNPDPTICLHPDCIAPEYYGIGYNRGAVLRRDEYSCQSCGFKFPASNLEVHHVLPKAQGGNDSTRNLTTLCKPCHFREDWFDHVHKYAEQQKRRKH